jgi:hypothetical protein
LVSAGVFSLATRVNGHHEGFADHALECDGYGPGEQGNWDARQPLCE